MAKTSARMVRLDATSGSLTLPDGRRGMLLQSGSSNGQAMIDGRPGTSLVERDKRSGRLVMALGDEKIVVEEV